MRLLPLMAILCISTQQLVAQGNSVTLKPAATYLINTSTKGNVDQDYMGQPMSSEFNNNSLKKMIIKDVRSNVHTAEVVTTKLSSSISMMGNVISAFDSDTSTDQSAIEFKNTINKSRSYQIEPNGACIALNKEKESTPASTNNEKDLINIIMGQVSGTTTEEKEIESYFMIIGKDVKEGSTWTTLSRNSADTVQYEWTKTENGIAVIKVTGKSNINNNMSLMGVDATASITSNISEIRKVNLTSGIIQTKVITTTLNGNIDLMGMSIPITGHIETLTQIIEQ